MPDVLTLHRPAPDFALPASDGSSVSLAEACRKGPVLLFFYPGDFTPICTSEVCAFRDDYQEFVTRGIQILGVSADPPDRHKCFAEHCRVPFLLLSDTRQDVARMFGAKGLLGMRRAYYLIGTDRQLLWQHAEVLPIFKLCNQTILAAIDAALAPT